MTAKARSERLRREKAKALVRDLHESELRAAGAARALALHQAEEQLERIARLLPDALDGGLTLTEIARITNVSRPTLYELRARYSGSASDLRFAVLQTLLNHGPLWGCEIRERLGGRDGVGTMLSELLSEGLADLDPDIWDRDRDTGPAWELTGKGFEMLENWILALDEEAEESE